MNVKALDFTKKVIQSKDSCVLLIHGKPNSGKFTSFTTLINEIKTQGDHVFILNDSPENKLNIKTFRQVQKNLLLQTYDCKQYCVIKNIEEVSIPCLNAFLKILEEPPKNVYFIITSNNLSKVLETIQSRSYLIHWKSDSNQEIAETELAKVILERPTSYFSQEKKLEIDKAELLKTLGFLEDKLSQKLQYAEIGFLEYSSKIQFLNQSRIQIDNNVNLKSVLLSLMLQFSDNQVSI